MVYPSTDKIICVTGMQTRKKHSLYLSMLMVAIFCCIHMFSAPLLGEEMRYASVAWNMFFCHNWFIPQLGDAAYLHKAPLLFWLLDLGWLININWPWQVIIPTSFALLTVLYTQKLAQAIFPHKQKIAVLAPMTLIAMPFFITNLGILRFDMMLTLFNAMACYSLFRMRSSYKYYLLFIVVNGLGLLTKGPVIYIFTVCEALVFCFCFSSSPWRSVIKSLLGILFSLSAITIWWGPIIYYGQAHLIYQMFAEQVVARATGGISVAKPVWTYVSLLPCFFLPWLFFSPFFQINHRKEKQEYDKRSANYLLYVFMFSFIIFSLIKTKESRYLLPLTPVMAVYIAYRVEKMMFLFSKCSHFFSTMVLGLALSFSSAVLLVLLSYFPGKIHIFYAVYFPKITLYLLFITGLLVSISVRFSIKNQVKILLSLSVLVSGAIDLSTTYAVSKTQNIQPAIDFINQLFLKNIPVASADLFALDMQFSGRWLHSIPIISETQVHEWAKNNPTGWYITNIDKNDISNAYAGIIHGCFEQSYSHMRAVLKICPIAHSAADGAK